jgi:hypothetical protein
MLGRLLSRFLARARAWLGHTRGNAAAPPRVYDAHGQAQHMCRCGYLALRMGRVRHRSHGLRWWWLCTVCGRSHEERV